MLLISYSIYGSEVGRYTQRLRRKSWARLRVNADLSPFLFGPSLSLSLSVDSMPNAVGLILRRNKESGQREGESRKIFF